MTNDQLQAASRLSADIEYLAGLIQTKSEPQPFLNLQLVQGETPGISQTTLDACRALCIDDLVAQLAAKRAAFAAL